MRLRTGIALYVAGVLTLAGGMAAETIYSAHQPPGCPDGHCPTPGGREYHGSWQRAIERAAGLAMIHFGLITLVGLSIGGAGLAVRHFARMER